MAAKRLVIFGWADSVHIRRWVSGLAQRGFEIKLISMAGTAHPEVETTIIPRRGRLSYFRQAGRAVREACLFKPHLIHAHYATGPGYWALKTNVRPSIISVWGTDITEFPSNPLMRMFLRRNLRRVDWVTATSRSLHAATLQLEPQISDRISIIPFGVTVPDEQTPLPAEGVIKLCYMKAHKKRYAPDILLQSLAKVISAFPNIHLTIAGTGVMTPQLGQMVSRLSLEKHVTFVGKLDIREIYSFIRQHHFMVMPSLREAFGVAVLEASACARATIATNVGGIPEVLEDGVNGILVPPNDVGALAEAIARMASEPELCRKLGRGGYEFVKREYPWQKSLDMMAELYERLIHEKKT